jgi:prophage regulatory protein
MAIFRIPRVIEETGNSRSGLYAQIRDGLMVQPIRIGQRAVGIPSHEVAAINAARIAGLADEQIKALVQRLHAERTAVMQRVEG